MYGAQNQIGVVTLGLIVYDGKACRNRTTEGDIFKEPKKAEKSDAVIEKPSDASVIIFVFLGVGLLVTILVLCCCCKLCKCCCFKKKTEIHLTNDSATDISRDTTPIYGGKKSKK